MLDYSFVHWSTFLTAAILLNISPGPDIAFILGQTIKRGRKYGFVAMFGIWTGSFIHVIFTALGLSAILTTSALAFSIVKWLGALYLIWLGIQALFSKGTILSTDKYKPSNNLSKIYKQGVLVSLLNPKVAIFFMAFLPQFVEIGAGAVSLQLFFHGTLIIIVAAFIEPPLVLIGSSISTYLNNNTKISIWLDRILGTVFISLGIKLATSERT